jgi:hypothetical protein
LQYQRTYMFPPKPTLIGLLGAALGCEDLQLVQLYDTTLMGIVLHSHEGLARDLWGITKLKAGRSAEHAVVVREILHHPTYSIYLAPTTADAAPTLEDMKAAFANPAYPLTLGRSDELVVVRTSKIANLESAPRDIYYRNTVLPFDYRKYGHALEKVDTSGGIAEIPQVFRLPMAYSYDRTRRRKVARYEVFTHVFGTGLTFKGLKESDGGWRDGSNYFFLF